MPDLKCPNCGHSIKLHNDYNCCYAYEKADECHCGWSQAYIILYHEREEARDIARSMYRVLHRPDVQRYLAWWNASRND